MREFNTAVWAQEQQDQGNTDEGIGFPIDVPIDGRKVRFIGATTSGISLVVAASQAPLTDKVATVTNFFFSLVEKQEDKDWFRQRLWDNKDPFGIGMMEAISLALIEEWSARPTQSASDSSASPPSTGRKSTARHRSGASTRSTSASTGS